MIREKKFIFVLILSFIFSFFLAFSISHPAYEMSDATMYDTLGLNLAKGYGYVDENLELTMGREPAYPFFLALVYSIAGHNYSLIRFAQIILFLLTVIFTYKIAKIVFDKEAAGCAMIMTAFFPPLVNYPAYILSETLFTFLLALFVFFCMKLYTNNKSVYYFLSGVTLGILMLCKSVMLFFIPVLFLWGILFSKSRMRIFLMILVSMGIALPWMYRNYIKFDTFALRGGSELALCVKSQKLDYGFQDFKKAIVFIVSENLGKKMFPDSIDKASDFLYKEDTLAREKILPGLISIGYTGNEIRKMMAKKIIARPFKFIAISSLDLLRILQFSYFPVLNQTHIIENFNKLPRGKTVLSLSRAGFRFLAYVLILFSIIGMYIKRKIWKKWLFLFIIVAFMTLVYSLIYGEARYSVPLIPYYIILSIPAILKIKEWIFDPSRKSPEG